MSVITETTAYVDRTLEAAEAALSDPVVTSQLGQRSDALSVRLGRLVPILSYEEAARRLELLDPDAIPLLVIRPGDDGQFSTATDQFSTIQSQSVEKVIERWLPIRQTPWQLTNHLATKVADTRFTDSVHGFLETTRADQVSRVEFFSGDQFRNDLSLVALPDAKFVEVSYRALVRLYAHPGTTHVEADTLLHELVHIGQKENNPIRLYSSQAEVKKLTWRDELEAYHVGATVIAALLGKDIGDLNPYEDKSKLITILIEQARLQNPDYDPADPFKPSESILNLFESHQIGIDTIIDDCFDFDAMSRSLELAAQDIDLNEQNK